MKTVKELKLKKSDLENQIMRLINKYEKEYNIFVSQLDYHVLITINAVGDEIRHHTVAISIDI